MEVTLEYNVQSVCASDCSLFRIGDTEAYPALFLNGASLEIVFNVFADQSEGNFDRDWPINDTETEVRFTIAQTADAGDYLNMYVLLTEETVRVEIDGVVKLEEFGEFKRVYDDSDYSTVGAPGHDASRERKAVVYGGDSDRAEAYLRRATTRLASEWLLSMGVTRTEPR